MKIEAVSEAPLARVAVVETGDYQWGYEDKLPKWKEQPAVAGNWGRSHTADPWGPCYTHDPALVAGLLADCVGSAAGGTARSTSCARSAAGL